MRFRPLRPGFAILLLLSAATFRHAAAQSCSGSMEYNGLLAPDGSDVATGSGPSLSLHPPAGCTWSVVPGASWITITGATSGVSQGTAIRVGYSVQANPTSPRQGSLRVNYGGTSVFVADIYQNSLSCSFSLSPARVDFPISGGQASVRLATSNSGCRAYEVEGYRWARLQPGPGFPYLTAGNYTLIADPNPGVARSDTLRVITSPASAAAVSIFQAGAASPLAITTASLRNATAGLPYSAALLAEGGTAPFAWSVSPGALPGGLTLDPNTGVISGTPAAQANASFTITVTDSGNPQQSATRSFALTINPGLAIAAASLPEGTPEAPYSATLSARWGTPPYSWSVISGSLPPDLSLDRLTGAITGTPAATGVWSFTARVADSGSPQQSAYAQFSIAIDYVQIAGTTLPNGALGVPYSASLSARLGIPRYYWSVYTGALPPGLALNRDTGAIAGTPEAAGTWSFGAQVTDSSSTPHSARASFSITILPGFSITTPSLPEATAGLPYTSAVTAEQGAPPYAWSVVAGALPDGLRLDPETGAIGGTPAAEGASTFTVKATDSATPRQSATREFTLTVNPALEIATTAILDGVAGVPYSAGLAARHGVPPYTWSVSAGLLPTGVILDPGTGALGGTPESAGISTFTVTVRDSGRQRQSAALAFTLRVNTRLEITTASLPDGAVAIPYAAALAARQGSPPYTWSVRAGALPEGLSLDPATGAIGGTPTTAGTATLTARVADRSNPPQSATREFTIAIGPGLEITTASLPDGTVAVAYAATLGAQHGTPPYTWSVASGTLPDGLHLDPSTGALGGTPGVRGNFAFTVKATDSSTPPQSAAVPLSIAVRVQMPGITITGFEATALPTQPVSLGLRLDAPAPADLQCELSLSFNPNAAAVGSGWMDPALQFAQGGTKASCTIPAGAATATVPQNGAIQQGTVAGEMTVTVTRLTTGGGDVLPQSPVSKTLTVARLAPVITPGSVRLTNVTSTGFTVQLVAYSTPRDLSSATFTFVPAPGAELHGPVSFTVPLSDLLTQWYASATGRANGSAFMLRVPFTLSGEPNALQSVSVTMTNSAGTSKSEAGAREQ